MAEEKLQDHKVLHHKFKFNVIASFPSFRSLWSLEEIIAILYLSLLVVQLQEFQAFKELYLPHTFMLCHKFDAYNGRINHSLQSRMNDIYKSHSCSLNYMAK
jgi:hypothetical protein